MATNKELAERREQLEEELRKVRQEIAARAGQTDDEEPEVQTAADKTSVKTATKK